MSNKKFAHLVSLTVLIGLISTFANAQTITGVDGTYHGVKPYSTFLKGTVNYDAWTYDDVVLYTPPGKIDIDTANLWLAWYHRADQLYKDVALASGRSAQNFDQTYRRTTEFGRKKVLGHPSDSCGVGCGNKQQAEAVGFLDKMNENSNDYVDHWILMYEMGRGGSPEGFYGRAMWPTNTVLLPHTMAGLAFYAVGGGDEAAIRRGIPGNLLDGLDKWAASDNKWVEYFADNTKQEPQGAQGFKSHNLGAAMLMRILIDSGDINNIVAILSNMSKKPQPTTAEQAMCDFQSSIREQMGPAFDAQMVYQWGLPDGCDGSFTTNNPPTISPTWGGTDLNGTVNQKSTGVSFDANDADGDTLNFSATGLPPGLKINRATGTILGTLAQEGNYSVVVTVNDERGGSDSVSFGWNVASDDTPGGNNTAPTIELTWDGADLNSTVNQKSTGVTFDANDADGDTLNFSATGLPPGLKINRATGTILGTLAQEGNYSVVVTVSDGKGGSDSVSFGWNVASDDTPANDNSAPSIEMTWSGYDLSSMVNQPNNSVTFFSSDADGDTLNFSATGLPPGLKINSATGTISGALTQEAGKYSVVVTVNDGRGGSDSVSFGWNVESDDTPTDDNSAPSIELTWSGYDLNSLINQPNNSVTFFSSDADSDTLNFSATGLPPGLTVNTANGTISGALTQEAGKYSVVVTVNDGRGGSDSVSFGWNVHSH